MRLAVFGASGRTGKLIVDQALAAGDEVVAFVRDAAKLRLRHARLQVVQGDLADRGVVERVVQGADAVICALSPKIFNGPKELPLTRGTRNILGAMQEHGVRRLVYSMGPSIFLPQRTPKRSLDALLTVIKLLPGTRPFIHEAVGMGQAIRHSDRDWTIVCVVAPNDKPATGRIRRAAQGKVGIGISRTDLAAFMLDQARSRGDVRQELLVSN